MRKLKSFLLKRPVISVIGLAFSWLVLVMVFGEIISVLFNQEFGNTTTIFVAHLIVFSSVFILLWWVDWLKVTGIARFGVCEIWLLVIAGSIYMIFGSLYSFYGKFIFDFSNLKNISVTMDILNTQIAVALNEEIFFRGII